MVFGIKSVGVPTPDTPSEGSLSRRSSYTAVLVVASALFLSLSGVGLTALGGRQSWWRLKGVFKKLANLEREASITMIAGGSSCSLLTLGALSHPSPAATSRPPPNQRSEVQPLAAATPATKPLRVIEKAVERLSYFTAEKSCFIGDVHGFLEQITLPLLKSGAAIDTGQKMTVYLDQTGGKGSSSIKIPKLQLNENYQGPLLTFLGDYIGNTLNSLGAFYLLADLLNQQEEIQKRNANYRALTSIVGNHELLVFYPDERGGCFANFSSGVIDTFAKQLATLIVEGKMQISSARGNILATHSCFSHEFLIELIAEATNPAMKEAVDYFARLHEDDSAYMSEKIRVDGSVVTHFSFKPDAFDPNEYQRHLSFLSSHLNRTAITVMQRYLNKGQRFPKGGIEKTSVLFSDCFEGKKLQSNFWKGDHSALGSPQLCREFQEPWQKLCHPSAIDSKCLWASQKCRPLCSGRCLSWHKISKIFQSYHLCGWRSCPAT